MCNQAEAKDTKQEEVQAQRKEEEQELQEIRRRLRTRGICVIIPTYNNVGTIRQVVTDALRYCADVFVVDDGSDDGTTAVLRALNDIRLLHYGRNRGKGYALKTGFRAALQAGFAYAITMDGDGQHFAKDIPAFLDANDHWPGALILGSRKKEGISRSKGSNFANSFSNFWFTVQTCRRIPDTQTGFRLYPLRKLWGYRLLTARYEAELELLVFAAWHGVAIHSIPVDVYYPPAEERVSHFRPGADFARISALNTLLCGLAVVYGLPCWLWRKTATILRTLGAFLFFVFFMMTVITPGVWIYVHCGRMTERKKWRLHLLIYHAARIVGTKIGVPGARYHSNISKDLDLDKPSVLICNHQSHLDLIYLLCLSPRLIFLTNDWVWHNPFYGFLIRHAEYYPAAEGIDALMPHFRSLISRGYSIAVFPEGTRSFDGHIARFHQGAFHVAEALGINIIPACLYGTGRVLKKRTYHLAKSPVYMEVGSPLSPSDLQAMGDTLAQARHVRHDYLHHYQAIKDREEQHA